jgi:hypothetical protein
MFQDGDKIVCLKGFIDKIDNIVVASENSVYTFKKYIRRNNIIEIYEFKYHYVLSKDYILLTEYRKNKLEKIKERIHESR